MIKCETCGFEAKNESGLRLHLRKHLKESKVETPNEYPEFVDIEVFDEGKLIVSYPVQGREAIELAKATAARNGYKIIIKSR
jgi:hypothetical protein